MHYIQTKNAIEMQNLSNFTINEILECGQCFRFEKSSGGFYGIIAFGKALNVHQDGQNVRFWYDNDILTPDDFEHLWVPYFDLGRDYSAIISHICKDDPTMSTAANFAPGIRLLQQDPWEMLISFIISQNNRIPQIKKVIASICERFGKQIYDGIYAFPTPNELYKATEQDLRDCKAGFRARYILDAAQKAAAGLLPLDRTTQTPTADLRKNLLEIMGVGEKVAHCILLFGYGRFDSFPVDTWVQKVMQQYYFDGKDVRPAEIYKFATEKFGEYSGFAQQYLFHYMRTQK